MNETNLLGIVFVVVGLILSFRLLVRGENWVNPDWLNGIILFAAFLSCVYGGILILD